MRVYRARAVVPILTLICLFAGCNSKPQENTGTQPGPSPEEIRAIAKEAYIYGFPVVANYQTMYKQAMDTTNPDYRAPFNTIASSQTVATPDDKFVVTPNSDTPYSFLWMDLRAEPVIVIMPKIEPNRYYTGQMIDLYTFNFAYLGTRKLRQRWRHFHDRRSRMEGRHAEGREGGHSVGDRVRLPALSHSAFQSSRFGNVKKIQSGYKSKPSAST